MKSGLLAALIFLLLPAPVAQNDNATIEGTAQRIDTKAPIAGVRVSVTTSSAGAPLYSASTGSDGHFVIADVPPGQYFVRAERDGYLHSSEEGPTTMAFVAAQQHLQLQALNFIPGAALGGHVRDHDGKAVAGRTMELLKKTYTDSGLPQLNVVTTSDRTNDRGEYQFPTVGPGEYYLRVNTPPSNVGNVNASVPTASPVDLLQPIYFPGVSSPAAAMPVSLKPGSAVTADIVVPAKSTLKVSGTIVNGLPNLAHLPQSTVTLIPNAPGYSQSGSQTVLSIPEGGDGRFELQGILPGSYEIVASAKNPTSSTAILAAAMARSTFTVGETDIHGITLTIRPGVEVMGKFVSDLPVTLTLSPIMLGPGKGGSTATTAANITPEGQMLINGQVVAGPQIRMDLAGKDSSSARTILMTGANGNEFKFAGVPPGVYTFTTRITPQPTGMYVADIRQRGVSIYDSGLTVGTQPPDPIEIVIKTNGGSIQGTVQGYANARYVTTLLPQGIHSGNSFMTITSEDPRLLSSLYVPSIPPGQYRIFAAERAANLDFRDPETVRKYVVRSVVVTVNAGDVVSGINLPLIHAGE